ncbi:MAG: flagellar hook capping FlgD N-terminal domain-containing protein [Alphaproteobacteria bacterium]|nr:flagellar hook capping FlgD N-terminal domain-containing protein [Alphaproteobacteria bacterium]
MVDLSAITGYTTNTTTTDTATSTLSADMNTFLKLLTTQLQYQDPLDPMDTAEFTNQLVQYSAVEQQIQTNSKLDNLVTLNISNLAAQAVSYIDKVVQVLGDVMPLENGVAKATYTLDKNVTSSVITVKDMNGNIVYSEAGNKDAGTYDFEWDGKDSDGNQLEDGAYQIAVTTNVASGETAANVVTTIFGKVTGIASDESTIYVGLGDSVTSQLGDILTIRNDGYFDKKNTTTDTGTDTGTDSDSDTVVGA